MITCAGSRFRLKPIREENEQTEDLNARTAPYRILKFKQV